MSGNNISICEYLRSIRFYLIFVSLLFIFSVVMGYAGMFGGVFEISSAYLKKMISSIKSMQECPLWAFFLIVFALIFLNNTFTCFINILSGPLIGVIPIFSTFLNGGIVGWYASEKGVEVFLLILPHGVFEIPAFLISTAIGLRLAKEVFAFGLRLAKEVFAFGLRLAKEVFKPARERALKAEIREGLHVLVKQIKEGLHVLVKQLVKQIKEGLHVLVKLVIPLLLIAAFIETSLIVISLCFVV